MRAQRIVVTTLFAVVVTALLLGALILAYVGGSPLDAYLFGSLRRFVLDLQGPTTILFFPNPFFSDRNAQFFLEMLPYALTVIVLFIGSRAALRRLGAPAALGVPYVRGERGSKDWILKTLADAPNKIMLTGAPTSSRVAVVKWGAEDGIAEAIYAELVGLNHRPIFFKFDERVPTEVDVVLTFAPHGRLLPILRQIGAIPAAQRPTVVHWNLEGFPDLRLPLPLIYAVGAARSRLDSLNDLRHPLARTLLQLPPLSTLTQRLTRFRYVGDYRRAFRAGWLNVFGDISELYTQIYRRAGLPAQFVPWGTSPNWYAALNLERDIDVLWMGKRRNRRRSQLLDQIREGLGRHGIRMYVADNVEHPFIFGQTRTQFLNRAKITLNIKTLWYNSGFTHRFHMVAGNRSLVVSEPFMPHCSVYQAGTHYVSAPVPQLVETIRDYLADEPARAAIVEHAYALVTEQLTFRHSIQMLMENVQAARQRLTPTGVTREDAH